VKMNTEKRMISSQIEKAERLAKEWLEKHKKN